MTLSPGRHAARTPGASRALTPSTTQGGHPGWRGAPVATTILLGALQTEGLPRFVHALVGLDREAAKAVIPSACACRREISIALLISCHPDRHRLRSPRHPAPCSSPQFPNVLPKRASPMTNPAGAHRYRLQQAHRRIVHRQIGWMPVSSWGPRSCYELVVFASHRQIFLQPPLLYLLRVGSPAAGFFIEPIRRAAGAIGLSAKSCYPTPRLSNAVGLELIGCGRT